MRAGLPTAVVVKPVPPGARADARAFAYREAAEHLRVGADDHASRERGVPLGALRERSAAERDALVDGAVVADLGRLAHDDAHAVVDEHAPADHRARMDLDAGEEAPDVRDEAAEPAQPARPAPVGAPVKDERMQPRVAREHLPRRARGGVALADGGDVFTQSGEHGAGLGVCFSVSGRAHGRRVPLGGAERRFVSVHAFSSQVFGATIGLRRRRVDPAPRGNARPIRTSTWRPRARCRAGCGFPPR